MESAPTQGFRLSPQQQHLWRVRHQEIAGLATRCAVEITGPLDRERLSLALEQAVGRHEILRTTFPLLPGMSLPVQVVGEAAEVPLCIERWSGPDWAGLGEEEKEGVLARLLAEPRSTPFDLARGPLLEASLLELDPSRHLLLLTLPAFIADAASARVLGEEITAAYGGRPSTGEPLQYADAAEVLHEWLESAESAGSAFWDRQDLSTLSRARLETGTEREAEASSEPGTVRTVFPPERSQRVEELAAKLGAPVSRLLLAAWQATLHRSTGEDEIVVGTLFDGRTFAEFESALGLFARALPVRSVCGSATSFGGLLSALLETVAEVSKRQDFFPFETVDAVLAEIRPPRWPFGFEHERLPTGPSPVWGARSRAEPFELLLAVRERPGSLSAELSYDRARFTAADAERLLARLGRMLDGIALHPEAPLDELDVLSDAEREEILLDFNRTASGAPEGRTAAGLFEEQARTAPGSTAVVCGDLRISYAELNARANRLAHHLRSLGVGPDSLVGLCLERSPAMVEGLLGVQKAGGAYVPLDPTYPAERLSFMMADSRISVLLTEERLLSTLLSLIPPATRILRLDAGVPEAAEIARQSAGDPAPVAGPENLAYVIYTSGSTGRPKGVMVPHRGLANYLLWARESYRTREGRGAPVHSAIGFDLTVTSLLGPLVSGTPVTLLSEEQGVGALAEALRKTRGFGLVKLTPAHLDVLRQMLSPEDLGGAAGALVIGGEALWAESLAVWREHAPETRLINEYGPTEATVGCSVHEVGPEDSSTGPVPIGRPIANTRLYGVGPGLQPVPAGVPGELWIGGQGLARGYLGRPDLTAERFVPDPFARTPGERAYRTGDLARHRPGGGLEFLGRIDAQVKIRGFRIEPGEIEAVLATHPAVHESVVTAREGEGGKRLVAYVVPRGGERPAPAELRRFLSSRLPEHMVPAVFASLEALPLTPNGKVDRRALPELQGTGEETAFAAPRTLEEDLLAEIWARVLGAGRVGIDDHFFTLGGDSIRLVQVLSLAHERGLTLTLQDLFRYPTIRSLAEQVRFGGEAPADLPEVPPFSLIPAADRERLPAEIVDAYPLARLQAGMVFHTELGSGSAIYHDLHSFHLRGRFDADLLRTAIDRVVERHPLLRTSFELSSFREPLQLVHRKVAAPLAIEDFRHLSGEEQERAIEDWLEKDRHRSFDWARPPLARFHVHLRGEDAFQFTLSFHHSILDGWSAASLLSELFRLYVSLQNGVASPEAPPPSASFREFVDLERRAVASEETREFWRRHLAEATPARLPRRRVSEGRQRARILGFPVPREVVEGLRTMAQNAAVPLKSVLLAAHLKVVGFLTGQADLTTGLIANGRPERAGGDQVLGLFLNTLPLHVRLGGETWKALARRAFDLERDMLAHRRYPLAEIQSAERGRPLFEISFNFLHYHVYESLRRLSGLEVAGVHSYEETNFPLAVSFSVHPDGSGMSLLLNFPELEIDPGQGQEIGEVYLRALSAMAAAPSAVHEEVSLLSAGERHRILAEWSEGGSAPAPEATAYELFEAQARRTPEAVALVAPGLLRTYGELAAGADRLARRLRSLGVGPESLVGLAIERSPAMVEAVLGILAAGGAYVPLDPSHPAERLAFMASDAGLSLLVAEKRQIEELGALPVRIVILDDDCEGEEIDGRPLPLSAGPDNPACVLYTSGTTGWPKGVVLCHRGLVNRLLRAQDVYRLTPEDAVLQTAPLGFDFSFWEIFAPLIVGGRSVLARPDGHRDPAYLARVIAEQEVTIVHFVPSMLEVFLRQEGAGRCSSLRRVFVGGEALTPALCRRFFAAFDLPLENQYGPTEGSIDVVWSTFHRGETPSGSVIGRPIANGSAYVLDAALQPVPPGVPGELHLGGVCLARGYLGRPELTASRFVPHPFLPGERLYRTGDLARHLEDGTLEYLGRVDHQVKIRGVRVELGEIEAALGTHPDVEEAVVVARGEGEERKLVAYLVLSPGSGAGVPEIRQALRGRLPEVMIPGAWVVLPALPLSPNGKVDRRALPDPDETPRASGGAFTEPRTEAERTLAALWRDVLRLDKVGLDDSFFDLGGHSLLLIQVQGRLQAWLGRPVEMIDLFRYPTVRALAAFLVPEAGEPNRNPRPEPRRTGSGAATPDDRIAIVGMAGRFPGARDLAAFWDNLRRGVESITFLDDRDLEAAGVDAAVRSQANYVPAAGLLDDVELFDAAFFGYTPRDAEITDPQHRLFLECAWEALEDGGQVPGALTGKVGVFAGVSTNRYLWNLYSNPEVVRSVGPYKLSIANDKDHVATTVSYKLNLTGPSLNVQTACSTSLVAVHLACRSLLGGECDLALAGGASIALPQKAGYLYQEGGIRSPDGHCRAFDARAQGMVGGSGAGAVALKRLADALADGDPIHAVILGSAINNDGSGKIGYTAPGIDGQAEVIASALAASGVDPRTVTYVEAHGTGTPLGDPIEVAALSQAFRSGTDERSFCALGSVKTNIGHLDAAAGVAGLIKAVLALEHRELPPSLHFETPNPEIDFESSPFYVNSRLRGWEVEGGAPRRAGVSSFGIGGTNAHLVLEEAPLPKPRAGAPGPREHLLVLSARTETALAAAAERLRRRLATEPEADLGDVAWTLATGRRAFEHRRALVCRDTAEAVALLASGAASERVFSGTAGAGEPDVVFLFPGQGAQHAGMGLSLYRSEPVFREELDRAAEILAPHLGLDLREVLDPEAGNPEEAGPRVEDTAIAQPALFAVEHALARLWMSWGVRPRAMLGHSVGEYVAACLAGVFELQDALELVAARGRLIASLPRGAMVSLPLSETETLPWLRGGLALAAVNGPARCVVSGPEPEIQALLEELAQRRVSGRRLRTSHAFHSAMMEPVLAEFGARVGRVRLSEPRLPYVSNLTGSWITASEATDPAYWVRHLRSTVRFADGLSTLLEGTAPSSRVLLEVGPGHALASLARRHPARTPSDRVVASLGRPDGAAQDEGEAILASVARLFTAGAPIDWAARHAPVRGRRLSLPTYPFERQRYWIDAVRSGERRPAASGRFRTPVWTPAPAPERREDDRTAEPWLVFLDDTGPGAALIGQLRRRGVETVTVRPGDRLERTGENAWTIDPRDPESYHALLASTGAPLKILHLWSLGAPGAGLEQSLDRSLYSLLFLARAAPRGGETEIVLVTRQSRKVTGDDVLAPEQAAAIGLGRTISRELPGVRCRAIDVALPASSGRRHAESLAARLAAEVLDASDPLVAYRGGERWLPGFAALDLPAGNPFGEGGTFLVTLDGSEVGLSLAEHLAAVSRARLVLGVAGSLGAGTRERLRRLEEGGALTAAWDDPPALRCAVERFGPLDGVIHATGLGDGDLFGDAPRPGAIDGIEGRLRETLAVAELCRELDPGFLALLSSPDLPGRAATGAFLDAFAPWHAATTGIPTLAFAWDGAGPPDPGEAVDALARALSSGLSQVTASPRAVASREPGPEGHARPALASDYVPPGDELEQQIAEVWQEVFGIGRIGIEDDFFDLGGDSLIALQLVSRLGRVFGVGLPARSLFDNPTISGLAAVLEQAVLASADPEELDPMLRDLEALHE
ncbi:MAG TPA: amino acid adenylation domain-containing protein [Thermoanaerobaculia bacterium]|nr:amino acid adenylation domain-containing protein [Thermoanaerobaculia bacterium]